MGAGCTGSPAGAPASRATGPAVESTPTPDDETTRPVAGARGAHVSSWSVDTAGDMLGVWVGGWGEHAPEALAVRTSHGTESLHASEPGSASNVAATLQHGWLIVTDGGTKLARLGADASVHHLTVPEATTAPRSGDVAVVLRNRVMLYRPSDDTLRAVRQPPMRWRTGGYVTPDGALVVAGSSGEAARWARFDRGRWSLGTWPVGASVGVLHGRGQVIAVTLGAPALVDATPVAGLALSDDGGATWRQVEVPTGLVEALSVAVTNDRTVFVSTGSGPLIRARPGDDASVVGSLQPIAVAASGGRLYALETPTRHLSDERVLVSRDHGRTWTRAPLPGRRAS